MAVGERLKKLREAHGTSEEVLRAVMGLDSIDTLQAMESGERSITLEQIDKALVFFDLSMDGFMNPLIRIEELQPNWRLSNVEE